MKILAVADAPSPALDSRFDLERWRAEGVDLVVSCGDLPRDYLEFLADAFPVPLYYVRGNHDDWPGHPGGENIDGRLVEYRGVRFLGIEGSPWYNGGKYQQTERSVAWELLTLRPKLWLKGGVDVVVAHAAPQFCPYAYQRCPKPIGVGRACPYWPKSEGTRVCEDAADHAHRGFAAFRSLILDARPRLFLHGHRHQTHGLGKRELKIGETRVIDVFGHVILEV